MVTLAEEVYEIVRHLPKRRQRTALDFVRFLAVQEVAESDSNDPDDPDSKVFDVTAAVERALGDIKAGRWRLAEDLINEL